MAAKHNFEGTKSRKEKSGKKWGKKVVGKKEKSEKKWGQSPILDFHCSN